MAQVEKKEKLPEKGTITPIRSNLEMVPSRLMERLEHVLGRWEPWTLWSRWPEDLIPRVPAINLFEEKGVLVVETELPGMAKEDVDIKLTGDVLTISGKREQEQKEERRDYYRLERSTSAVTRSIKLPAEVQADKMTAELKDGVLTVRAPRAEPAKAATRQVPVT